MLKTLILSSRLLYFRNNIVYRDAFFLFLSKRNLIRANEDGTTSNRASVVGGVGLLCTIWSNRSVYFFFSDFSITVEVESLHQSLFLLGSKVDLDRSKAICELLERNETVVVGVKLIHQILDILFHARKILSSAGYLLEGIVNLIIDLGLCEFDINL